MSKRKILFATTNHTKVDRVINLVGDLDIEWVTLDDLPEKIDEPVEVGDSAVGIAKNKALYYFEKIGKQMPVLAQDDTIDFLGNVSVEDDPKSAIKEPVIKAFSVFNNTNAIKYYSMLADKYGGEIEFAYKYGHGFANSNEVTATSSALYAKLVKDPKGVERVGKYPLDALTKLKVGDDYIYSVDVSKEDHLKADSDFKRALLELLA